MAPKKDEEKALANVSEEQALVIPEELRELGLGEDELVKENLQGIDNVQFPVIKALHQGVRMFQIQGEEDPVKEIEAVIIHKGKANAYWEKPLGDEGGGGSPPDCASGDGVNGNKPREIRDGKAVFGQCATCHFNQFGSDPRGGKACKNTMPLYLMRGDNLLPEVFVTPPTSLQSVGTYMTELVNVGLNFRMVTTKFRLVEAKNKNGVAYSKLQLTRGPKLTQERFNHIAKVLKQFKTAMEKTNETLVRREDVETSAEVINNNDY